MNDTRWPVPIEELLGKTATEAQAIIDAKRRELNQAFDEVPQDQLEPQS